MPAHQRDAEARRLPTARRSKLRFVEGLALALGLVAAVRCSETSSSAPQIRIPKSASLAIRPSFATLPAGAPAIDLSRIRGVLLGANGDSVVSEGQFEDGRAVLVFTVQFTGNTGVFRVDLTAYDRSGQVAFRGTDTVTVKPGDNPPVAPPGLKYAGPDAGVAKIQVVPNPVLLDAGSSAGLAVTGTTAAGAPVPGPIRAGWTSRDTAVAAVDQAGIVHAGNGEGSTYVVASSVTGAVDSTLVKVKAPIATFTVTPNPAAVAVGDSLQLVAVMQDAAGHPITGRAVAWFISDGTKATISATGKLYGKRRGGATVSAITDGGKEADLPVSVVSPVDHIEATPSPMTLASLGEQQTLAIKVVPHGTADVSTIPVAVAVGDPSIVSMDANHVVTALRNGTTTITITADVATLSVPVTVKQVAKTVTVSPKTFSAASAGLRQKFAVQILDARNQPVVGAVPDWKSSGTAVATVDNAGTATTVDDGTAQISAAYGGLTDAATVTVKRLPARVNINVPKQTIRVGETMIATGSIVDANGFPMPSVVTWSSSNSSILSVTSAGAVSGVALGTANLQAAAGGMSVGMPIAVSGAGGYGLGGEIITINDIDQFRTDYANAYDNYTFYNNIVDYSGSGPRASQKKILWYTGHLDACDGCDGSTIRDSFTELGYTVVRDSSDTVSIASDVKVIFLFLPTTPFSVSEMDAFRSFLADGGRIVFVGEHPDYYGYYGLPVQNAFFSQLGSAVRMTLTFAACDTPGSMVVTDIATHQTTTGVTRLLAACAAKFDVGPSDIVLGRDSAGMPTFVLTRPNSAPAASRSVPSPTMDRRLAPATVGVHRNVSPTDPVYTATPRPKPTP